ncbi:MAG: glycerophosphoryl diester phosphodiesterase membrane domain-containing protein [Candidatus Nealsonbacteria bacterium]|nr:glycerophosphoryl diester phosphodiesterase membrane domain-containing protein [Candidatus Nealsonbacteria bacterium]
MSEPQSPSRESANRIGRHISLGFQNYIDHWQEWILPMLLASAIAILSMLCCWLPYFLVLGPITCGLYCCAISALKNRPFGTAELNRGWKSAGSSIAASLFISFLQVIPVVILLGGFFVFLFACGAMMPSGPIDNPRTAVETADDVDRPGDGPEQFEEPPPEAIFAVLCTMMAFYAGLFLAMIVCWAWALWLTTRTMFVFPLIADGRCGFTAALRQSWTQTRQGFWELLVINLVAGFIAMMGMYAMYIGVIFTLPIYFTIIASVYEERFQTAEEPGTEEYAGGGS